MKKEGQEGQGSKGRVRKGMQSRGEGNEMGRNGKGVLREREKSEGRDPYDENISQQLIIAKNIPPFKNIPSCSPERSLFQ